MPLTLLSLGADQLAVLFPGYLGLDSSMRITSVGPALNALMPGLLHEQFSEHFHLVSSTAPVFSTRLADLTGQHISIALRAQPEWKLSGLLVPGLDAGHSYFLSRSAGPEFSGEGREEQANEIGRLRTALKRKDEDLQQAAQLIRENAERLLQVIQNVQGGLLFEDEQRRIVVANQQFCDLFSIPVAPGQLTGMNCEHALEQSKDMFESPDEFLEGVHRLLQRRKKELRSVLALKDGRYFSRDYVPIFIDGCYKGHLWHYTDVTDTQMMERKLEDQREFYEQILNEIPADIAVFDRAHRYLFVNPVAVKNSGIRNWIIGKTDEDYCRLRNLPLEVAAARHKLFTEVVKDGRQKTWEEKMVDREGNVHHHLRKMYPVFGKEGKLDIMIGYGVEITEMKEIEEQIRLSEARYKAIFDNSQALICTHDLDGRLLTVNPATVKALGFSQQRLIGQYIHSVLPASRAASFKEEYLQRIATEGHAEGVMIAVSAEGKKIYLLYQNYLVQEADTAYVIGFAQDITQRINAENALRKSEEKYRSIIENMNLGLLEVDNEDRIVYANHSFCEMSGYEAPELLQRTAQELFLKGENMTLMQEKDALRRHNISDAYEIAIKNKRGDVRWWLISGAPVLNHDGELSGTIGIHLDITQQKHLELELRKAKAEAEYSAHAKEMFLANMSHEIRTPMNAIIGMSRLLKKTVQTSQEIFYTDAMLHAAENLLVIINDVLDFSKIEAGKVSLEQIGFRFPQVIHQVFAVLRHKAEEKALLMDWEIDDALSPVLIGDPYRINQILLNLLSNAIKFTEAGSIRLRCVCLATDRKTQKIRIDVTDTGVGMTEAFLEQLFEKFTQEDASVVRKFGGTGLGMSICKQLVELMGGTIEVTSRKGEGTTVSVLLDIFIGDERDLPVTNTTKTDTRVLSGKQILLVEDNTMNRLIASTFLGNYGATVAEAQDGREAVDKIRAGHYDLVLMDVQMPVMNGLEATAYIREHLDEELPIIALTANALKGEAGRCLNAGMNDFVSKPFEEEALLATVTRWLGATIEQTVHPTEQDTPGSAVHYDLSKLRAISRGNHAFVEKMIGLFMTEVPRALHELDAAAEEGDYARIYAVVHRLKPSVLNMGIEVLREDMAEMEQMTRTGTLAINAPVLEGKLQHLKQILNSVVEQLREEYEVT